MTTLAWLKVGARCWAKFKGFPWWPVYLHSVDKDDEIDQNTDVMKYGHALVWSWNNPRKLEVLPLSSEHFKSWKEIDYQTYFDTQQINPKYKISLAKTILQTAEIPVAYSEVPGHEIIESPAHNTDVKRMKRKAQKVVEELMYDKPYQHKNRRRRQSAEESSDGVFGNASDSIPPHSDAPYENIETADDSALAANAGGRVSSRVKKSGQPSPRLPVQNGEEGAVLEIEAEMVKEGVGEASRLDGLPTTATRRYRRGGGRGRPGRFVTQRDHSQFLSEIWTLFQTLCCNITPADEGEGRGVGLWVWSREAFQDEEHISTGPTDTQTALRTTQSAAGSDASASRTEEICMEIPEGGGLQESRALGAITDRPVVVPVHRTRYALSSQGGGRDREGEGDTDALVAQLAEAAEKGDTDPHWQVVPRKYTVPGVCSCLESQFSSDHHHHHHQQPFAVKVHPQVCFLCDVHAHLSSSEVIGFLAGRWEPTTRELFVQMAFPVAAEEQADGGKTDVEMDPVSACAVKEAIQELGLSVVGWYHSHPRFSPNPSTTDIDNQRQYQVHLRDEHSGLEPFVGLIVSTFDKHAADLCSKHQWFHVVSVAAAGSKQEVYSTDNSSRVRKASQTNGREKVYLPMLVQVVNRVPIVARSIRCNAEEALQLRKEIGEFGESGSSNSLLSDTTGSLGIVASQTGNNQAAVVVGGGGLVVEKGEAESLDKKERLGKESDPSAVVAVIPNSDTEGISHFSIGVQVKDTTEQAPMIKNVLEAAPEMESIWSFLQPLDNIESPVRWSTAVVEEGCTEMPLSAHLIEPSISSNRSERRRTSRRVVKRNSFLEEFETATDSLPWERKLSGRSHDLSENTTNPNPASASSDKGAGAKRGRKKKLLPVIGGQQERGESLDCGTVSVTTLGVDSSPASSETTLLLYLRDSNEASRASLALLCSLSAPFRAVSLTLIGLAFYYRNHPHRIDLHGRWKGQTKADKFRTSAMVWANKLGLVSSEETVSFLDEVMHLIQACWSLPRIKQRMD